MCLGAAHAARDGSAYSSRRLVFFFFPTAAARPWRRLAGAAPRRQAGAAPLAARYARWARPRAAMGAARRPMARGLGGSRRGQHGPPAAGARPLLPCAGVRPRRFPVGQRPWPWPQRPGREHWWRAQTRRVQPRIRPGTSTARGALRGSATAHRRLRLAGSRPQPPAGAAPALASARARPSGARPLLRAHPGGERDPCCERVPAASATPASHRLGAGSLFAGVPARYGPGKGSPCAARG